MRRKVEPHARHYILDGPTNDNAWAGNWFPTDPGETDNVLFTGAGAINPGTDSFTNVATALVELLQCDPPRI